MKLWTEHNLPELINQRYLKHCKTYSEMSDLIRYELLFKYGGIYLDCDFENFKPIDTLINGLDLFASTENEKHICGGFIGSTTRHPEIKKIINAIPDSLIKNKGKTSDLKIGPTFVTQMLKDTDITVLDKKFFYPYLPGQKGLQKQLPFNKVAYAAHHWAGSWLETKVENFSTPKQKAKRLHNKNLKQKEEKISGFSIIIPYKEDVYDPKGVRKANYDFVVNRYREMFPKAEIVIGRDEVGDDLHFCRASAINNGVKKSTENKIIIADADLIIRKEAITRGLKDVEYHGFVIPWGLCYDVTSKTTEQIIKSSEIDWFKIKNSKPTIRDIRQDKLAGGIQIILRNVFNNVGGYNEKFYGWGYEDTDFCMRLKAQLTDYKIFPREEIIHLWHPRLYTNLQSNRDLYNQLHPEYPI